MMLDLFFQFAASLPECVDRIVYIEGVCIPPVKAVSHQVFKTNIYAYIHNR